jgi:hypothetical protein
MSTLKNLLRQESREVYCLTLDQRRSLLQIQLQEQAREPGHLAALERRPQALVYHGEFFLLLGLPF